MLDFAGLDDIRQLTLSDSQKRRECYGSVVAAAEEEEEVTVV